MTPDAVAQGVLAWQHGRDQPDRYQLLREIKRKRIFRFRTGLPEPETLIVKTWASDRGSWVSRVRRSLVVSSRACEREFAVSRRLETCAPVLAVPRVMGRFDRIAVLGEISEVLLSEDLGECEPLSPYVKARKHDEAVVGKVESFAVESAYALLVDARVIDDDHSMLNMVHARRTDSFHRIDFEVAIPWADCFDPGREIGGMLGRLVATYTYAFQPDLAPVNRMIDRLVRRLDGQVPARAWRRAHTVAAAALERQRQTVGIDARPDFTAMSVAGGKA